MRATSKMLRRYGWCWEDSVENMIRVLDSFIKQLFVNVLAQFFKHGQMHCVVSASFRPAKESINSLPVIVLLAEDKKAIRPVQIHAAATLKGFCMRPNLLVLAKFTL